MIKTLSSDKSKPIEWGMKIVNSLDATYKEYSWFEKRFISARFAFDFITAFSEESWFNRFLCASHIPFERKYRCLYDSDMIAEYIYGGIPHKFPLAHEANRNGLTEEDARKLYNEFWQKVTAILKED